MCGRYTLGRQPDALLDYFHLHGMVPAYHLSWNIAPSQSVPVVLNNAKQQRICQIMRWGLIPAWSSGPDARYSMINAKAETIAGKVVSVVLIIVSMGILAEGVRLMWHPRKDSPAFIAVWAALLSVLVKELLYRYKSRKANQLGSTSLAAEAWHHRGDAFSSLAALIGVVGGQQYPVLDAVGAMAVGAIILFAGARIFWRTSRELMDGAPRITDHLDQESAEHFAAIQETLVAAGIAFEVNTRLVRGLDYYTRTVFEWVTDQLGAQGAVCSGGRYDGLVAHLGGRPTPAIGWAIGLERLVELYQTCGGCSPASGPDAYLVAVGPAAAGKALALAESWRDADPGQPGCP